MIRPLSSLIALPLLAVLACNGSSQDDTGAGDGGSTDGGSTDGGSTDGGSTDGGSETTSSLDFSLATIPTVGVVTWAVDDGTDRAWVTFGVEGDSTWTAQATIEGGEARAVLLGMRPELEHQVTAWEAAGSDEHEVDSITAQAGAVIGTLPTVGFTVDDSSRSELFMLGSVLDQPSTAGILNSHGEWVWWHASDTKGYVIARARVARDGSGIIMLSSPAPGIADPEARSYVLNVAWTGELLNTREVVDGHHDFVELQDGTIAFLSEDTVPVDGEAYVGDRLMELSPDGKTTQLWSVWDDYTIGVDEPNTKTGSSWSHSNALYFDADSGIYTVGLRNFNALVGISRDSGELLWQLGGERSDYDDLGADAWEWQHQFEWLSDTRLLLFDNGTPTRNASRATEIEVNHETGATSVLWQHMTDPPIYCSGPGDVYRLDNGNTLISWGSSGRLQEVTQAGEVLWDAEFEEGGSMGYAIWLEDLNNL